MKRTTTIGLDLPAMLGLPDAPDMRALAARLHIAMTIARAARLVGRRLFFTGIAVYAEDVRGELLLSLSCARRRDEPDGPLVSCAYTHEAEGRLGPCVPIEIALA